mmetsp:Transcript_6212/g.8231  ORF Transcript_6212/g.8231 Transcript_6212/m.8231 type:complete len:777 (+) Transcript_6212:58-2388(+)
MSLKYPKSVEVNNTSKFSVIDVQGTKLNHVGASSSAGKGRDKQRAIKSSGGSIKNTEGIRIGGDFQPCKDPEYLNYRVEVFDRCLEKQKEMLAGKPKVPITVSLPDGTTKEGTSWETTPMDIAKDISQGLAQHAVVARITYTSKHGEEMEVCAEDGMEEEADLELEAGVELWDMTRPLIGDCKMEILKFDDKDAKTVFWHSSSHVMGLALEKLYGCHLTIGPPLQNGFYYDCYMGEHAISEKDFKAIEVAVQKYAKAKQKFERLVLSKEDALDMFKFNPFKVSLISNKIPDGGFTTVYRNGDLIDLCRGPHLPHTGKIQGFAAVRNSSTNWLGNTNNDPLQRVYGIAFPDKKQLKTWLEFQEQAKQRDHRRLGTLQDLFFFHQLSPGSAFFLPHGARIYNKLVEFIKKQYWKRGYDEVVSPNVYNMKLWEISGHAKHYRDDMFIIDVEDQEFGLKPMNCPGHCLMFANSLKSYRELPIRMADFGVLHRNELSGALTGLTRVRRFQQDDAHIFCREDQIKNEVLGALDFMKEVYGIFGMSYKLELSTKPEKALGDHALWEMAESELEKALDEFAGKGNWQVNPGDGAFYGPKIDIKVFDAMERVHQCATVQLDFQLPIRFDLRYKTAVQAAADGQDSKKEEDESWKRPVMVHRAMLGSVERIIAILTEHFGGKWPFWLSPRQVLVVPVGAGFLDYATDVQVQLKAAGFFADVETSNKTLNKKVREGQLAQYNFILVVGATEQEAGTVNVRTRENKQEGAKTIAEVIEMFKSLVESHQ